MNPFKARLQRGERLIGFEVDLAEPCISEMTAACGFDFIWIDTEHQAQDYETVLNQIIACRAGGAASLVRVPQNEPFLAKRVLEMGPDGIIFPNVNSPAELQKAMDACLYPPQGKRGFGPRRACGWGRMNMEEYIRTAADSMCRFVQLEHYEAIACLDKMLKIEGCDGFIIGPCDLSGSLGLLNQIHHPKVLELIDTALEKCTRAGRPLGIAVGWNGPEEFEFWSRRGFQFISAGSDAAAIVAAARTQVRDMRRILKKTAAGQEQEQARTQRSAGTPDPAAASIRMPDILKLIN